MTRPIRPGATSRKPRRKELSEAELDKLVEQATVDAYDESEQTTGFYTMFEDHLAMPFGTEVLGVKVSVEQLEITDDDRIVAVCRRNNSRQRIPILDLPLPDPRPEGAEWIDAYRRWAHSR